MKFTVVRDFIDRHTKNLHRADTDYSTDDQDRAEELKGLGFIKDTEAKESKYPVKEEQSILDNKATEITQTLTTETPKEELETLLEAEKKDKNRKTVIDHIESLLV